MLDMACTAKCPNFKFEVLNAFRVMITQGRLLQGLLYQFPGSKDKYNIQCLASWPHSKWRNGGTHVTMMIKYFWKCLYATLVIGVYSIPWWYFFREDRQNLKIQHIAIVSTLIHQHQILCCVVYDVGFITVFWYMNNYAHIL